MRSFLFVPADSERKLARSLSSDADAVIFDLEDAVLPQNKAAARQSLATWLGTQRPRAATWVRVNPLGSEHLLPDLAALVPRAPAGIVLPKIRGPEDIVEVSAYLAMAEAMHGIAAGSIQIIALCTETPLAVLRMADLATARLPRLAALSWGAEDLSAALGAVSPRTGEGAWHAPYEHARTLCLLAARALGVRALDTVYVDVRDANGCRQSAARARADGFDGKLAIHPDQVQIIHDAFKPSAEELARAQRIVAAFTAGQGAILFEGQMLDLPHLNAARRLIEAAR